MQETQAGITALVTAYARAYHATHDSPKIFDDFLADKMYTAEEHVQFDLNLASALERIAPELAVTGPDQATALAWVIQLMHGPVTLSRSRYTEDNLEEAVRQGVRQYIILGAGLDTFIFRRPELVAKMEVFELDHPATQAMKRQRMAIAGWDLPAHAHLIPVDFTKERLTDVLAQSTYDPHQLTFVSWLGVTYYLTSDVVFATLKAIAGIMPSGSTIVFDYMDADAFDPDKAARRTQLMQATARMVGEPMKSGFYPQVLADALCQVGWALQENLAPVNIEPRYFQGRTDRYHAFEHVHFAKAVVI